MTANKRLIAVVAAIGVIVVAVAWSLASRPIQPTGPTPGPTVVAVAPTPAPTIVVTAVPTVPPTPIPTVPPNFAAVPAELLSNKGGPTFPLPGTATVTSSRAGADGSWRLTATVADRVTADSFYGTLSDAKWPPSATAGPPGSLRFDDASGRFAGALVRVYVLADQTAEVIVSFIPKVPKALPNFGWLSDVIPQPNGEIPSTSPLPDFPAAWRPAGLTIVAETESNEFFYGLYTGSADSFAAIVAAYEALVAQAGGTSPTTVYSDDRTEALVSSSLGYAAVITEDGTLQVAVEVAR